MSKPTRTDNNKPSQSTPIRKGTMTPDMITKVAEELTKNQLTTTGSAIKTYKTIVEKKAPKIEPVEHGNYEIYSEYVKAHCKVHDIYETTANELNKLFPQNKSTYDIVRNLKRSHGISWRRVENGNNDTYVFFVEPTREELIVQLTSAESKVIEMQCKLQTMKNANSQTYEALSKLEQSHIRIKEENTQLKSDLSLLKRTSYVLFRFAIGAIITIIFKSVAL